MTTRKLTQYQEKQLLHLHLEGNFQFKTEAGTRVPRKAWQEMIDALVNNGYIDSHAKITAKGKAHLGL